MPLNKQLPSIFLVSITAVSFKSFIFAIHLDAPQPLGIFCISDILYVRKLECYDIGYTHICPRYLNFLKADGNLRTSYNSHLLTKWIRLY